MDAYLFMSKKAHRRLVRQMDKDLDNLKAENERLRKALEELLEEGKGEHMVDGYYIEKVCEQALKKE